MYIKREIGKAGENIASEFLRKQDYIILGKNFRTARGEIDIIAKEKNEIVFIEVKTRSNKIFGKPSDAVDTYKKMHIYKAAEYYMYKNNIEKADIRFDVIEVYIMKKKIEVNHLKQVFE